MSKERYVEHTVAWELPIRDSVTKGNYNLADIETKYLQIQTEVVSDNKDKTINKLQQRIAELEKQLAEKEKRLKQIDDWKVNYGYTNYDDIYTLEDLQSRAFQSEDDTQIIDELLYYFNISDENKILPVIKQQLKSQPAEIVEKIKNYKGEYFEWKIGDKIYPAFKITEEDLDTILKEYQK